MSWRSVCASLAGVGCLLAAGTMAQSQQPGADQPAAKPAPAPKDRKVSGNVKAVSSDQLVVEKGKREWRFAIGGSAAAAVQKVRAGDRVSVSYRDVDGKLTATEVTVRAPRGAQPGESAAPAPPEAKPKN